ncbi:ABC transporter ATP-binding protein [Pseudogemmobacter hezensis]|uniref:ABC transporter ATP-binding protein n=1 Tax=Pseudogemmobacter hezensis TaxID=2737662 RepID=UPI00345900D3
MTVTTRNHATVLVENLEIDLRSGEIHALVGESGSGKSLSALAILGLLPPALEMTGQITPALRPGRDVALVMQDPVAALDPRWRVGRFLTGQFARLGDLPLSAARTAARAMLGRLGLTDIDRVMAAYPHQLSGGMAQRVMIGAALAGSPAFLLADEPTTALDVTTQAQILSLLQGLCRDQGLGMLLITHDLGVVAETAARMTVLYGGQVMERGPANAVLPRPVHPYTRALLRAMPDLASAAPPAPIAGQPGRPSGRIGCAFAPRCAQAGPLCTAARPQLRPRGDGAGDFACHHPEGDAA